MELLDATSMSFFVNTGAVSPKCNSIDLHMLDLDVGSLRIGQIQLFDCQLGAAKEFLDLEKICGSKEVDQNPTFPWSFCLSAVSGSCIEVVVGIEVCFH